MSPSRLTPLRVKKVMDSLDSMDSSIRKEAKVNTVSNIDLVSLIEHDLGQGKKSGHWIIYHCPFHVDKNPSFGVTNGDATHSPGWRCFGCGKRGGAVKWLMEYHDMSYADALDVLKIPGTYTGSRHTYEPPIQEADTPPVDTWQARALNLIERAESVLWDERGRDALAWLHARGLQDNTIRAARLGYLPLDFQEKAEAWGIPNDDMRPMFFFRGLLIPGLTASKVWYLKMRPDHPRDGQKYKHARGGKQALYLADTLTNGKPAIICEGELDALLLTQEVKGLASVVTLASSSNGLNLATWGLYLLRPSAFILAYDMDKAGDEGAEKLAWLHDSQRLKIPSLRDGDKDITNFHKSGGNLRSLVENTLEPVLPIRVNQHEGLPLATMKGQYREMPDNSLDFFYYPNQLEVLDWWDVFTLR